MSENTGLFNLSVVKKTMIKETVKEIYDSLKEKGYNPINQIVGYLMSGDENYISNYINAREKIL